MLFRGLIKRVQSWKKGVREDIAAVADAIVVVEDAIEAVDEDTVDMDVMADIDLTEDLEVVEGLADMDIIAGWPLDTSI